MIGGMVTKALRASDDQSKLPGSRRLYETRPSVIAGLKRNEVEESYKRLEAAEVIERDGSRLRWTVASLDVIEDDPETGHPIDRNGIGQP